MTRSWEEMFTPQFEHRPAFRNIVEDPANRQAITWSYRVRKNGGDAIVGHSGSDPGVTTLAYFYLGRGTGALLMINTSSDSEEFSRAVSALFAALMKAAGR